MLTYSINLGTPIESTSYPLTNLLTGTSSTFNILLDRIYDNEFKIVTPRELRDFVLSINSSTVFKLTKNNSGDFIGFDKGYPTDPDLKGYKIVIGNKSYNNNEPILNVLNINSDDDIILSKTDNLEKTKIAFLTNSQNYPYIETSIDLDITNKNNINIISQIDTVSINNLKLPSITDNIDINNKYLAYQTDRLVWENNNIEITDPIISNDETKIEGNLYLNNFPLEFKDDRKIPISIGDIKIGDAISNKLSIADILKRITYNYLPPELDIKFIEPHIYNAMEFGTTLLPKIEYVIYKKSLPINTTFINLTPSFLPPTTINEYFKLIGLLDTIINNPIANSSHNFTAIVNDGENMIQKTLTLDIVYPIYYGFSTDNIISQTFLSSLNKIVIKKSNLELNIQGTGTFYFIFPYSYGLLNSINGTLPSPTISSYFFNSPQLYWQNIRYYVYRFNNVNITQENISFSF